MATEENNNQNGDQKNGGSGENNSSSNQISQTTEKFQEYIDKILEIEISDAASNSAVKETIFHQAKTVHHYMLCCLIQSEAACTEYANIANCITSPLGQSITAIQTNIAGYITYGAEMEKALTAAMMTVKDAKAKLSKVNDAACKLENAMKDSCNSEQLKVLVKGIRESEDGTEKKFKNAVQEIQDKVDEANDIGYHAFETGIKVAGIAKFANVQSMDAYGKNVLAAVALLTTDVAENIAFGASEKEKLQKELTTEIQELSTAQLGKYLADLKVKALGETKAYAEEPDFPTDEEGEEISLETICEKVEGSFNACEDEPTE